MGSGAAEEDWSRPMSRRITTLLISLGILASLALLLWKGPSGAGTGQEEGSGVENEGLNGEASTEGETGLSPIGAQGEGGTGEQTTDLDPEVLDDPASRAAVEAPNPGGVVLDGDGKPAEGAVVTWTPRGAASEYEPGKRWEAVREASLEVVTDARGRFEFDRSELPGDGETAAIWVTHVGSSIEGQEVSWGSEGPYAPLRFELTKGEVCDAGAAPEGTEDRVPFAVIRFLGTRGTDHDPAYAVEQADPFLDWALPVIAREFVADGSGSVPIPVFQASGRYYAEAGQLRSPTVQGVLSERRTFPLMERFTLRILLELEEEVVQAAEKITFVAQQRPIGEDRFEHIGITTIPAREGVHDVLLPTGANREILVQFHSERSTPFEDIIGSAAPGSVVEIRVQLNATQGILVHVLDLDRQPIAGAYLYGLYFKEDRSVAASNQYFTNAEGSALITGLPEVQTWVEVMADGYAKTMVGPWPVAPLDTAGDAAYEIILEPSASLAGVVTSDGEPVDTFQVCLWRGNEIAIRETFRDVEDGRFELEEVPVGHLNLRVASATHGLGPSLTQHLEVKAGESAEVEVKLEPSLEGFGRVVDGDTGEPIEGAVVTANISAGWRSLTTYASETGEPGVLTDVNGEWRALGFSEGRCNIEFTAEGYPLLVSMAYGSGEEPLDFGTLPLYKGRDLTVVLRGAPGQDLSGCTVSCKGTSEGGPVPTSADGIAVLKNLPIGRYNVRVDLPDGSMRSANRFLHSTGNAQVEWDLEGSAGFNLEFVNPEGSTLNWEGTVFLFPVINEGRGSMAGHYLTRATTHEVRGLAPGEYLVEARDKDGVHVGVLTVVARSGRFATEAFPIQTRPIFVRVLDVHGNPIPNVEIDLAADGTGRSYASVSVTDLQGLAEFHSNPDLNFSAWLRHPSHGTHDGVEVVFPRDGSPAVVTMDGTGIARARLLRRGEPLTGISVMIANPSTRNAFSNASPDADGKIEFRDIGPGPHVLIIRAPGCWPSDVPVASAPYPGEWETIEVPSTTDVRLELGGPGLQDLDRIDIQRLSTGEWASGWLADGRISGNLIPTKDGVLTLVGLPEGRFRWAAVLGSGEVLESEFYAHPDESENIVQVQL